MDLLQIKVALERESGMCTYINLWVQVKITTITLRYKLLVIPLSFIGWAADRDAARDHDHDGHLIVNGEWVDPGHALANDDDLEHCSSSSARSSDHIEEAHIP